MRNLVTRKYTRIRRLYDELTSSEHGWQIIADDAGVYPERIGVAGRIVFGFDD